MRSALSPDTQAILLLTAPLIVGKRRDSEPLLTAGEYSRLATHLRDLRKTPADFLSTDGSDLLHECRHVIEEERLRQLLDRGFLLSQAIEQWHSRAIWVVSRADGGYPSRLKTRLREASPAILYGCGEVSALDEGGLAVVGSRHVSQALRDYTAAVGELAARAGRPIVSGGAKGIDQAAMGGALDAGGRAVGVLAESLAKKSMVREHRNLLIEGRLVLISPYDPCAGFNVGNAMQRNKVIYALADAGLIVSSDFSKGGTWAGATEQLNRFRSVPLYVRASGKTSEGLTALQERGALSWPDPESPAVLDLILQGKYEVERTRRESEQLDLLNAVSEAAEPNWMRDSHKRVDAADTLETQSTSSSDVSSDDLGSTAFEKGVVAESSAVGTVCEGIEVDPAARLIREVWNILQPLLVNPMTEAEIAEALDVSKAQARSWLQRFVQEGRIDQRRRPVRYAIRGRDVQLHLDSS